jgi:NAD(P)-dependent dehydrogenase (short-subunit alcohol dehydrogenase family)
MVSLHVKGNVAKAADLERLFAETKKAYGTLDVLVNNAGIYKFVPLEEITEEEFHRQFNINVLGTILATKEAVKHFGPWSHRTAGRHRPRLCLPGLRRLGVAHGRAAHGIGRLSITRRRP